MRLVFSNVFYEKAGGAENLIYEIIKAAYTGSSIDSVLIGNPMSYVVKRLSESGIPFQFYSSDDCYKFTADAEDLFIHFHFFDGMSKILKNEGSAVIWGILAPQITQWNRFGFEKRYTRKRIVGDFFTKRLIRRMNSRLGLLSMDGATSDAISSFLGADIEIPMLPIPVDLTDRRPIRSCKSKNNEMVISYIGRSDDIWKIKPVKKVIQDLSKIIEHKFVLNIYTDSSSPYENEFKDIYKNNISINYHFGLYGPALRDHLSENSDVHFSMGTAALEGALCGLPTFLVDPCINDYPSNYCYKWLFETDRNSLGRFIDDTEKSFPGVDINTLVTVLSDSKMYADLAEKTQQYLVDNHSVETITKNLITYKTLATNADICRYTPATWEIVDKLKILRSGELNRS